ncbi:unnamed protein product [Thlaspi arvense]|uniref:Uncharacterized protein n=1 Tax=Thlaspi arvense TaxID=13288 RepID=A0AAU9R5L0_THLAR|nr:unnamed protein product [Thlaspi arvense]
MCSKTSNGRKYGDDYSGLCPKKQKHNNGRRRVPRRGPGVAELEKIRLEEQHNAPSVQLSSPSPPPPPPPREKPPTSFLPTSSSTERTGPVYPFPSYFSTGSFPDDLIPQAPIFQRNHDPSLHYLPPILAAKRPLHFLSETTKCSVVPTMTISRDDGKQIKSVDQRLKNHFQDSGTTIRNPITIDSPSPSTPSTPMIPLHFPRFLQVIMQFQYVLYHEFG